MSPGMYTVRDCTAGFRAIRSSIINKIDPDTLKVKGYAFQISLLHEAILNHAKVREVPVVFVDRTRGETKLGLSDIIEFMLNAWWIRFERSKTFLKFAAVGASGVVVNLASFTLLMNMGLNKFIASPIAIELSIITNFLFNNFWTFSKRDMNDRIHIRGLKFNIVSFAALARQLRHLPYLERPRSRRHSPGPPGRRHRSRHAHQLLPELLLDVQGVVIVEDLLPLPSAGEDQR